MYTAHQYPPETCWQEDQVVRLDYRGTRDDLAFWGTGNYFSARISEWLLAVGVILGAGAVDLGLIEFTTVNRGRSRVAGRVYSLGSAAAILISLWSLLYRMKTIPVPRSSRLESFSRRSSLSSSSSPAGWAANSSSDTVSASSAAKMKVRDRSSVIPRVHRRAAS